MCKRGESALKSSSPFPGEGSLAQESGRGESVCKDCSLFIQSASVLWSKARSDQNRQSPGLSHSHGSGKLNPARLTGALMGESCATPPLQLFVPGSAFGEKQSGFKTLAVLGTLRLESVQSAGVSASTPLSWGGTKPPAAQALCSLGKSQMPLRVALSLAAVRRGLDYKQLHADKALEE